MRSAAFSTRLPGKQRLALSSKKADKGLSWGLAEVFAISQTALPAILFFPGTQFLRPLVRIGTYAISLVFLWLAFSKHRSKEDVLHPAWSNLKPCLVYLTLMIFHPFTASTVAGVAAVGFYVAILAPVLWVPLLVRSQERLERLFWILLICNGVNSFVGIMQVQNPGRWMPAEFSNIVMKSAHGLSVVSYTGAGGQIIIRPPGLFDTPGAVAGPGMFAGFLGLVLFSQTNSALKKGFALFFCLCGITVIYLTLVRSALLVMGAMLLTYAFMLQRKGWTSRSLQVGLVASVLASVGFSYAQRFGGESIKARFETIVEENPGIFYYRSRGEHVANGFKELLPEYPLGAGLGRWGMVAHYTQLAKTSNEGGIWAETQFPGWIIDGGAFLLVGYCLAIYKALRHAIGMASSSEDIAQRNLAMIVVAASAGSVLHCFSFPVFSSQGGLQFWFLLGGLYGISTGKLPVVAPDVVPDPTKKLMFAR